ncbi:hypothetical protein, partial [uncultured Cyclobacterium sp.]|uniref:hypothetical protein n=1 Tax=uncultured Cyclobacterium sp. TaxID=453820 RepID=UPI0030ECB8AE
MNKRKFSFIQSKASLFILLLLIGLSTNNLTAQQAEISGGLTKKILLGDHSGITNPSLGYAFGFNHHVNDYRLAHSFSYGFNFEVFKVYRVNSEEIPGNPYQQVLSPKALFRYDYFVNDHISLFSGGEVGFQFINLKSDQEVVISTESSTNLYTKAVLSPQIGVNFEINPYLTIYYQFAYDLGYYIGGRPN